MLDDEMSKGRCDLFANLDGFAARRVRPAAIGLKSAGLAPTNIVHPSRDASVVCGSAEYDTAGCACRSMSLRTRIKMSCRLPSPCAYGTTSREAYVRGTVKLRMLVRMPVTSILRCLDHDTVIRAGMMRTVEYFQLKN